MEKIIKPKLFIVVILIHFLFNSHILAQCDQYNIDLYFDVDYPMLEDFDFDKVKIADEVVDMVDDIKSLYRDDLNIHFSIKSIFFDEGGISYVHSQNSKVYSEDMLDKMQEVHESKKGENIYILLTGQNWLRSFWEQQNDGGRAEQIGGFYSDDQSYLISKSIKSQNTLAHEIGHLLGGEHCDSECNEYNGLTCFKEELLQSSYTIMCSASGISNYKDLKFSSANRNNILGEIISSEAYMNYVAYDLEVKDKDIKNQTFIAQKTITVKNVSADGYTKFVAGNLIKIESGIFKVDDDQKKTTWFSVRPNYFDCDAQNEVATRFIQSSTIEEEEIITDFKPYLTPNPVSNNEKAMLNFYIKNESYVNVSLHDFSGKIVKNIIAKNYEENGEQQLKIDLNNVPLGIYIVIIQTIDGTTSLKLIKD